MLGSLEPSGTTCILSLSALGITFGSLGAFGDPMNVLKIVWDLSFDCSCVPVAIVLNELPLHREYRFSNLCRSHSCACWLPWDEAILMIESKPSIGCLVVTSHEHLLWCLASVILSRDLLQALAFSSLLLP